ncbi:S49 family peptidase, partial [Pasteurella multocida]|uniref:S49 family peptidase n=1 Tax=Pasteurella multocida TaxID=747 RepID=UPI00406B9AF8
VQVVLDTEAAVYSGQEAIDAGLADELVNSTDAITVMRDALDARKSRLSGGRMTRIPGYRARIRNHVIAVSCVKLLSAHNSTQHTSRKHKV